MTRLLAAASLAASLCAGAALAQAPAAPPSTPLSAGASDLKQACAGQLEAVIVYQMERTHASRPEVIADIEGVLNQAAVLPKEQAGSMLERVRSTRDQDPPAFADFTICILERRQAQP